MSQTNKPYSNIQQQIKPVEPVAPVVEPAAPVEPVIAPVVEPVITTPVIPAPLGPVPTPVAPIVPPVQPAPIVPPAPVVPVAPVTPVVQNTVVDTSTPFTARIDEIKEKGTTQEKAVVIAFEAYIAGMKPGVPVAPDRGARHQYAIWKTILSVLENAPKAEFNSLWNIILAYFNNYKDGVFGDRYLFRFSDQWIWSENDLTAMQNIFNLLMLTANPATRKEGLSKVQLEKTLSTGIADEGRDRVNLFYLTM